MAGLSWRPADPSARGLRLGEAAPQGLLPGLEHDYLVVNSAAAVSVELFDVVVQCGHLERPNNTRLQIRRSQEVGTNTRFLDDVLRWATD
jgi:hypothetical protein